jgi:segregation and condensation protein A
LQLIERAELDITRLALAQVTDQYLAHLKTLQEEAAEEVSAFLVIATRLIQIKSEALLPRPPVREEGEEDPGESLARQLRIYKRYKEIASFLENREERRLRCFVRLAAPPKVEGTLDLSGLSLTELVKAGQRVFSTLDARMPLNAVVSAPRVTIREKIRLIAGVLISQGKASFRALLGKRTSHLDTVVTFLALLELVKRRLVQAQQEQTFGDILLEPNGVWEDTDSLELEFGE